MENESRSDIMYDLLKIPGDALHRHGITLPGLMRAVLDLVSPIFPSSYDSLTEAQFERVAYYTWIIHGALCTSLPYHTVYGGDFGELFRRAKAQVQSARTLEGLNRVRKERDT